MQMQVQIKFACMELKELLWIKMCHAGIFIGWWWWYI